MGRKVVCAMSGGVDSSVAAALLLREGYEVIGAFMRLGSPKGVGGVGGVEIGEACETPTAGRGKQGCCSVSDAADARRVADVLGIPLYVLNFEEDFGRVIDYFVAEYNAGRTPNPCVRCNDWLKFGKLAAYAEAVGADFVASGHYARVVDGRLRRGVDARKDQSYVLFGMPRAKLGRTLLPIGGMQKPDVRRAAEELGLPVYNKPDSQEICFVPDQDYAGVIKRRSPESVRPGVLVDAGGAELGGHAGHQHFTIGQRKGLGVSLGHRMFVTSIDPVTNRVTLGEQAALLRTSLEAGQANFLAERAVVAVGMRVTAKVRYNHEPAAATLTATGERSFRLVFDEPLAAVTPGQAAVCYDGDELLVGGWIDRAD